MGKDKSIDTSGLPQNEVFNKKEVFQHPQPADTGAPLDDAGREKEKEDAHPLKTEEKASRTEGLNEETSAGKAGAFEGFEDQAPDL